MSQELKPCPWCGGCASFEQLENTRWSVGCLDIDGDCMGFQSLQTFATKAEASATWNRRAPDPLLEEAERALESVLIGGNHLALLIGCDHPPYTASPDDALEHYGAGDVYDIWCCWRSIMLARATLSKIREQREG